MSLKITKLLKVIAKIKKKSIQTFPYVKLNVSALWQGRSFHVLVRSFTLVSHESIGWVEFRLAHFRGKSQISTICTEVGCFWPFSTHFTQVYVSSVNLFFAICTISSADHRFADFNQTGVLTQKKDWVVFETGIVKTMSHHYWCCVHLWSFIVFTKALILSSKKHKFIDFFLIFVLKSVNEIEYILKMKETHVGE